MVNFIIQHPNYDCCHVIAILNLSFSARILWVDKAYSTEYMFYSVIIINVHLIDPNTNGCESSIWHFSYVKISSADDRAPCLTNDNKLFRKCVILSLTDQHTQTVSNTYIYKNYYRWFCTLFGGIHISMCLVHVIGTLKSYKHRVFNFFRDFYHKKFFLIACKSMIPSKQEKKEKY